LSSTHSTRKPHPRCRARGNDAADAADAEAGEEEAGEHDEDDEDDEDDEEFGFLLRRLRLRCITAIVTADDPSPTDPEAAHDGGLTRSTSDLPFAAE
jgi:hypothetical protein